MRLLRGVGWVSGAVVAVLVLGPIIALLPAAMVDRTPDGSARGTLLYLALAASDPFVWTCAWHSLTVSVVVAFGSWFLGVALARVVARWRFWGRGPLAALAWAPLAVPAVVAAIGIRGLLAEVGPWPGAGLDLRAWLGWIWVGLATGVPLVALVTAAALGRIDPAWEDAARLAGASRRGVWSGVVWPLVRPETARALAAVFTATVLDPSAPLVLGLRKTLAYQVVEAALAGPAQAPRAASLTLLAIGLVGTGRLLVRWWGHARWPDPEAPHAPQPPRATAPRALAFTLFLAAWATLALLPAWGALRMAVNLPQTSAPLLDQARDWLVNLPRDAEQNRIVLTSLALGLATGLFGLALACGLATPGVYRPGRWSRLRLALGRLPESVPPLAFGVGVLVIPELLDAVSGAMPASNSHAAGAVGWLAAAIDPLSAPGVALLAALVAANLPTLLRATELGLRRAHPALADAARSVGASELRVKRTFSSLWLNSAPGAALAMTCALAATSLVPALLLARIAEATPLGPAILMLSDEPGGGLHRAAVLAGFAVLLNLVTLAFACRRSAGAIGDWFRG